MQEGVVPQDRIEETTSPLIEVLLPLASALPTAWVSAEFLRGRGHRLGTEAVGCYMIHEKNSSRNSSEVICNFYYDFPFEASTMNEHWLTPESRR